MDGEPSILERFRRVVLGPPSPERQGISSMIDLKAYDPDFPIGQRNLEPIDGPAETIEPEHGTP